jgi:hypothetical protein
MRIFSAFVSSSPRGTTKNQTMESYLLNLAQDSGVILAGFATVWLIGYLVTDALLNKDEDNQ